MRDIAPQYGNISNIPPSYLVKPVISSLSAPPFNPSLAEVHRSIPPLSPNSLIALETARHLLASSAVLTDREDQIDYTELGGLCTGNRFIGISNTLNWANHSPGGLGAVLVTSEYRLAPENPQAAALEDTHATLAWMSFHADELGFNPDKLIVVGGSEGGNLAAGVTLLARDRPSSTGTKINIAGQLLIAIPLHGACAEVGPWTRSNHIDSSNHAFGVSRDAEHVTMYTLPERVTEKDLVKLPPTCLDVGTADIYGDQVLDCTQKSLRAGIDTEIHLWSGCWHAFDDFVPTATVTKEAWGVREQWLRGVLGED
ncbi:Alpha/Beta hydrolase protein [Aspergillus cavernicola]|uniref:Alpha/Beta hydrolase protein n=1 Tax=Aspergillus cavernicola TaxID=176166 RepID=A0ABR4IVZ1_9EURO